MLEEQTAFSRKHSIQNFCPVASGVINLDKSKREYLVPVPLAEINANKNMQQNTGY